MVLQMLFAFTVNLLYHNRNLERWKEILRNIREFGV